MSLTGYILQWNRNNIEEVSQHETVHTVLTVHGCIKKKGGWVLLLHLWSLRLI